MSYFVNIQILLVALAFTGCLLSVVYKLFFVCLPALRLFSPEPPTAVRH